MTMWPKDWQRQTLGVTPDAVEAKLESITLALRDAEAERDAEIKRVQNDPYMRNAEKVARIVDVETKFQKRLNRAKDMVHKVYDPFVDALEQLEDRLRTPSHPLLETSRQWDEASARGSIRREIDNLSRFDPGSVVEMYRDALQTNDRVGAWVIQDHALQVLRDEADKGSGDAVGALADLQAAISEAYPVDREAVAAVRKARKPLARHYNYVTSTMGAHDIQQIKSDFGLSDSGARDSDVPVGIPRRVSWGGALESTGEA